MGARKYTDEQINSAAEMRESGMAIVAIARELGMSKGAVYWHCLALGAEPPKPIKLPSHFPETVQRSGHTVRRFSPDEDRKIIEMERNGAGVNQIARALGRRHNSVLGRLRTLARHEARKEEAA